MGIAETFPRNWKQPPIKISADDMRRGIQVTCEMCGWSEKVWKTVRYMHTYKKTGESKKQYACPVCRHLIGEEA